MLRKMALVAVLAAAVSMSACDTLQHVSDGIQKSPLAAQIVVQQATARIIERGKTPEERQARAARVVAVTARVKLYAAGGEALTVVAIEAAARVEIAKLNLGPADLMLVNDLVQLAVQELQKYVGTKAISPDQLVTVSQLLGWAEEAAAVYGA